MNSHKRRIVFTIRHFPLGCGTHSNAAPRIQEVAMSIQLLNRNELVSIMAMLLQLPELKEPVLNKNLSLKTLFLQLLNQMEVLSNKNQSLKTSITVIMMLLQLQNKKKQRLETLIGVILPLLARKWLRHCTFSNKFSGSWIKISRRDAVEIYSRLQRE